jgi:uncharacterized membrane protein (UPF0136 family)
MPPPGSAHPVFTLGALTLLGGTVGYVRKGSTASLIAGLGFGGLLIGQRYLKTGKFMPAGLVAVLGAGSCAFNVMKAMEWKP